SRTRFGRYAYATGGNAEAARLAGVRVNVVRAATFAISGLAAGIAGVILVSEVQTAQWNANTGIEFDAITAIVLGGTSLLGGEGAIWRSVLGAFFLQMIGNGFNLLGTTPELQYVIKGLVLAAAGAARTAADGRRGVRRALRGGVMSYRVAMDIGGTFTDFVMVDEGSQVTSTGKTSTTPASPEQGVLEGLTQVVPELPAISFIVH